jgi:hypothetical protein
MAKAHTIDDVIKNVIDNYQTLLKDAVVHVSEQAKKDIKDKTVNVLYKYYYGKYEPKSYDRIYALQYSIVPFSKISTKGQKIECIVGVEYSPSALEDYLDTLSGSPYKASKKYGRADADWVVQNFWEGKHPYTDGSTDPESASGSFGYHESAIKQDEGMRKTDETGDSLLRYAFTTFPNAVMHYMLIEGSKLF